MTKEGSKRIQLSLTLDAIAMLEEVAQKNGVTKSVLIEMLIRKYLRKEFK